MGNNEKRNPHHANRAFSFDRRVFFEGARLSLSHGLSADPITSIQCWSRNRPIDSGEAQATKIEDNNSNNNIQQQQQNKKDLASLIRTFQVLSFQNKINKMALLRYQLFLVIGVGFMSIWYALLTQQCNKNDKDNANTKSNILIVYAPIWAIILLGIYAVVSIGYGLMNFKDTPEAAKELDKEIVEAKAAMKRRGILK